MVAWLVELKAFLMVGSRVVMKADRMAFHWVVSMVDVKATMTAEKTAVKLVDL